MIMYKKIKENWINYHLVFIISFYYIIYNIICNVIWCLQNGDLRQLFYLMSVAQGASAYMYKEALDQDAFAWSPTLSDVILVFLNWGKFVN